MIGTQILHYKVIEKLGEGGMGVVYLAEDTKLERQVAIKFLPHHIVASSDERKRFEIEAKSAAALNHPNIATIHNIEEDNGELFLVMEYIEGRELKKIVETTGPLSSADAINYATQIAKGLHAAHEKGIVHRDIKSSNIMVSDKGQVKIMDFGLAKFRGSAQLTQIGTTIGTAAYMSPEQARGEELDQRSDIWAFGVILYELLTGALPFKGEYEAAIMFAILNDQPELISDINENVPEGLIKIINKCLEKDKHKRYPAVDNIVADIKTIQDGVAATTHQSPLDTNDIKKKSDRSKINKNWLIGAVGLILVAMAFILFIPSNEIQSQSKKMLVVLPFENLGNTDQEYFADGITSEITSKLSGLSGLGVIARSSAMQYKNSQKTLQQIGEELGVQYILEGTVQWEQTPEGLKRVRVNPELIQIKNAVQMWSKPYEADFSSAFKLQADIAATVASALNLTLLKSEQQNLDESVTDNPEAYDLYLRAMVYAEFITDEKNIRIAANLFKKAISIDKNFAAAYAGLSTSQSDLYWQYFERTEEILIESEKNAQKALSIDSTLPIAHVAMGNYHYHGRLDYDLALKEYNQALKLQPNNLDASNGIGFVLRRQGKMSKAISYFLSTLELDPLNFTTVWSVAETYFLLKNFEKGMYYNEKAMTIAPQITRPIILKSNSYIYFKGNTQEARNILLTAKRNKMGTDDVRFKLQFYLIDIMEGEYASALTHVADIKEIDDQFYFKPYDLLAGFAYRFAGNSALSKKSFESAKVYLLDKIKEQPKDSRKYSSLGLACAGLGNKTDAIRNGKRGFELLPMEREAWRGSFRLVDLAKIYTMVGEHELALQAIEKLLSSPTDALSVWLLKLDPVWDPLRANPRFEKIIKNAELVSINDW